MDDVDDGARRLWTMANLATPMALRVAATLRLADHIAAGRGTPAELAAAAGVDPDALTRLLRYLAVRRVFRAGPDGRYTLTPLGEALRDDHPSGTRGWLDIDGAGRPELAFVHLLHSIRTGEAAFPAQFGRSFWDDLAADPDRADSFHDLLGAAGPDRAREIAGAYPWSGLGHLVDVGGGGGAMLIGLLGAHPELRGTLVDRAGAVVPARKALAAAGLADRAQVVAGSFFDPLPGGAGGYLVSLVLHNWPDDAATAILRRCAEAAGRHGSVLVVENVGRTGGAGPPTGMDLRMLAYCGGRERTADEVGELARRAGLRLAGVHPAGGLSVLELVGGDRA